MNIGNVVAGALRASLVAESDITDLVGQNIYIQNAAETTVPYIRIVHISGGDENNSPRRSFDTIFRVTGVSSGKKEASDIANLIDTNLTGAELTFSDGFLCFAPVRSTAPYADSALINNANFYEFGAFYRIRGVQ